MVNPDTIRSKISLLTEYLEFWEDSKKFSEKEFLSSKMISGSVDWYQDVATILHENSIIREDLKQIWISTIKFRNLLVHEYAVLEKKKVYRILQDHLEDIKKVGTILTERYL